MSLKLASGSRNKLLFTTLFVKHLPFGTPDCPNRTEPKLHYFTIEIFSTKVFLMKLSQLTDDKALNLV